MLPIVWSHKRSFIAAWIATLIGVFIGLASPVVVRRGDQRSSTAGDWRPIACSS